MKILVAIDSLKGCLDSWQAGRAAAEGVHDVLPGCEVCCLPVSDGGEGMLEMLRRADLMRKTTACVHGPLMERLEAAYGLSPDGQTAFIEMAAVCGFPLVPEDWRNPMLTTTYGLGELMADAVLRHGCRRLFVGLGGSATNDAGLGMLQALGYRFLNQAKDLTPCYAAMTGEKEGALDYLFAFKVLRKAKGRVDASYRGGLHELSSYIKKTYGDSFKRSLSSIDYEIRRLG